MARQTIKLDHDTRELLRLQHRRVAKAESLLLSLIINVAKANGVDVSQNQVIYDPQSQNVVFEPWQTEASSKEEKGQSQES